jgi:hypothetical protein
MHWNTESISDFRFWRLDPGRIHNGKAPSPKLCVTGHPGNRGNPRSKRRISLPRIVRSVRIREEGNKRALRGIETVMPDRETAWEIASTKKRALWAIAVVAVAPLAASRIAIYEWIRSIAFLEPMRYFMIVLRGVFLEASSVRVLANQLWPMVLIGMANMTLVAWLFRRRVY